MNHSKLFFTLFLFASLWVLAQNGNIRGNILDDTNAEALMDATITIQEVAQSTTSDLDGAFSFNLPAGLYTLIIEKEGFESLTFEQIEVISNETQVLSDIFLYEESNTMQIGEISLSGSTENNTEQALMTLKKKSPVILDGISAAKIQLTGDANALESARRITGVTVEEGKYVYVRGLGDRYSKTTLNGVDIPGLDPDRNTLQLDIFPSSLLNNIVVSKNFSAEQPADFTGGLVNIETLGFPNKKFLQVSVGVGFNPQMNFTSDYLDYDRGQTDFLGFDDGTRELPSLAAADPFNHPHPFRGNYTNQEVSSFIQSFNPNLAANRSTSLMNSSLSISFGDQINFSNGNDLGYFMSFNLKNAYQYYDEVTYADYQVNGDTSVYDLLPANVIKGEQGEYHALLSLMGGLAYKTNRSKYRLTAMHLQSGQSKAGKFSIDNNGDAVGQSGYLGISDNLEYSERSLTNILLSGDHKLNGGSWEINWKLSPTFSKADDPDIRKTAFSLRPGTNEYYFSPGEAGLPSRIWRELDEYSISGLLDITKEYQLFNRDAKLKFGGASTFKSRSFDTFTFFYSFADINNQNWAAPDADLVLQPDNIYPNGAGGFYEGGENEFPRRNAYEGESMLMAGYISNEFPVTQQFKAILGVRVENFQARHTGGVSNGQYVLDNEEVLNSTDFFPSANLIYSWDKMNLRAVYSRTIARPSFKELSFAQIIDPITNRIFNGGLFAYPGEWDGNLRETYINNFDVRWEYFMKDAQLLSVSAFYKSFQDPIELVRIGTAATSTEFQPRNVGEGTVYGAEIEIVKNLDFISPSLKDFQISTNLTVLHSEIEMTDTEFNQRTNPNVLRDGQTVDRTREMVGQSPYTLNAGIIYKNKSAHLETGLFYNVKGSTLFLVTNGVYPDVYQEPFHDLNFSIRKSFGAEQQLSVDFQVSNILNDTRDKVFEAYNASNQLFESLNPNTTFSLTVGYKIF